MIPLFIAYFTPDYERQAVTFRESLDALGLKHDIQAIDSRGDWQANTSYKPLFVQKMMQKHRAPVIYNDVDSFILHKPRLLEQLNCDIAAAKFGTILLSGTVYFNATEAAARTVEWWVQLATQYPRMIPAGVHPHWPSGGEAWDQRLLELAITDTPEARFTMLPPAYCWMIGLSQKRYPDVSPVIVHTHASLWTREGERMDPCNLSSRQQAPVATLR